jgi:hypothetical protein
MIKEESHLIPAVETTIQGAGEASDEFNCPITLTRFSDPVVAADGRTYERAAIETWLAEHTTSPLTNLVLPHLGLRPDTVCQLKMVLEVQRVTAREVLDSFVALFACSQEVSDLSRLVRRLPETFYEEFLQAVESRYQEHRQTINTLRRQLPWTAQGVGSTCFAVLIACRRRQFNLDNTCTLLAFVLSFVGCLIAIVSMSLFFIESKSEHLYFASAGAGLVVSVFVCTVYARKMEERRALQATIATEETAEARLLDALPKMMQWLADNGITPSMAAIEFARGADFPPVIRQCLDQVMGIDMAVEIDAPPTMGAWCRFMRYIGVSSSEEGPAEAPAVEMIV